MAEQERSGGSQIVVGLDFSELGNRAVIEAIEMAQHRPSAELHVVVVGTGTPQWLTLPGDQEVLTEEEARETCRERVAALVDRYRIDHGHVPLERVAVYALEGSPAKQLVAVAKSVDADTIVVGTHGRTGARRLLLGSVAEEVVRTAPCNVIVLRPRDFFSGEKVPDIEGPLAPGAASLKPLHHRRAFHYVDRNSRPAPRIMPAL
jgi:nucleotide-binding universal stress UspA family protein